MSQILVSTPSVATLFNAPLPSCELTACSRYGHHCSPREKAWASGSELLERVCNHCVDNLIRPGGTPN
jgi:hypothetical protein